MLANGFSLESEWQQISRTLLSIQTVLNNTVIWMVSTHLPTSKSSSPFSNPLVTVPNAPITIGIIVTCMFHSFFNSLARSRYLFFFSHSFSYILWSHGTAKSITLQFLFHFFFFFFFRWLLLSLVFWPRLGDPCVCQSPIGVYVCNFPWKFFTSALVDRLSLEFEGQKLSSSLHDASQYSGRSQ